MAALAACSPTDRFSAGKPISREELGAMAEALLGTETAIETGSVSTTTETEIETDGETKTEKNTETTAQTKPTAGTDTETHPSDTAAGETHTSDTEVPDTETVYWTKSGKVYHTYADCQYIRNSANVQHGTVEESGKDNLCKTCEKRQSPDPAE